MRVINFISVFLSAALASEPASAHYVQGHSRFVWSWAPIVIVSLAGGAIWYVIGLIRLKLETRAVVLTKANVRSFAAGMAVLFLALVSPIDTMGAELFSIHMVQHLLLMLAAAPLIVLGRPALAYLWAMPPRRRRAFAKLWRAGRFGGTVGFLMQPILVWLLFAGVFVFWHLPGPYEWALNNETIHDAEHLSFFIAAMMFWTIVLEPSGSRRLGYGSTLLYVATMAVLSGLPGALMILTPRAFYAAHELTVASWGLTPMADQQLAGLIMWIPAGMVYIAAIAWLFLRWIDDHRRPSNVLAGFAAQAASLAILCFLLTGCGQSNADTDLKRGGQLISQYGCGACHTIPGIDGASGNVGPPLNGFGRRLYIAGMLKNTPENLASWIQDPQAIVQGNVMPNMGITPNEARQIAAYVDSLK
jgi:putative membrane protein